MDRVQKRVEAGCSQAETIQLSHEDRISALENRLDHFSGRLDNVARQLSKLCGRVGMDVTEEIF